MILSGSGSTKARKQRLTLFLALLLSLLALHGMSGQESGPQSAENDAEAAEAPGDERQEESAQDGDEDLDAFFEQAFGIAPEPEEQPVRVMVDGEEYGRVTALVTPAGTFTAIEAEDLLRVLDGLLNENGTAAIQEAADEEGYLSTEALSTLNITLDYDRTAFVASLGIPGRYRGVQQLSIYHERSAGPIPPGLFTIEPATVSGGTSLRGSASRSTAAGVDEPVWASSIAIAPFVSAYDWLLTGSVEYSFNEEPSLDADNVYLRRLWPERMLQVTVGDVNPGLAPFQSAGAMQGAQLTQSFDSRPIYGDPLAEFTIDDSQDVEVYVNDYRIYRRALGAGRFEITDVPLSPGVSEVEVRFPDSEREPVRLSLPYGSELLPEGAHGYSYAIGIVPLFWDERRSPNDFETHLLRLNGVHRYGVTRDISAGAGLQASPQAGILSLEGDTATGFGNFGLEGAVSLSRRASPGWGVGGTYGLFFPGSPARQSLRFSTRWVDKSLSTPARPDGIDEKPLQFGVAYGQRIGGGYSTTFRGDLRVDPVAAEADYGFGIGLNSPRIGVARLSAQIRYDGEISDRSSGRVSGSIYFTFAPQNSPVLLARQNLAAPESNITLQESGTLDSGSSYSAAVGTSQNFAENLPVERISLDGGLEGRRGGVSARSYAGVDPDGGLQGSGFGVSAETGLYFADTTFGWARSNGVQSFALISVSEGDGISEVAVGQGSSPQTAKPGFLGTTVLKGSRPYEPLFITLTPATLPLGYELTPSRAAVRTGLGTGAVVSPRLEGTVFVRGTLVSPETGAPLALTTGRVYPENEPERSQLIFTNQDGRFEAQGLTVGDHTIELTGGAKGTITIPPGTAGLYRLGELELEAD